MSQAFGGGLRFALQFEDEDLAGEVAAHAAALLPRLAGDQSRLKANILQAYMLAGQLDAAQQLLVSDATQRDEQLEVLKTQIDGVTSELEDESLRRQRIESEHDEMYQRYLIVCAAASLICLGLAGFLLFSLLRLRQVNAKLMAEMAAGDQVRSEQGQLKRRMSRLQRMESLGALAGGVAHDFNNLLVGVLCNAELIQSNSVAEEVQQECVQGIIDSAEAAADLSQMMLAYTGKHAARTETIDLGELLADMMPLFRAASLKHAIRVEPGAAPVYALADATQIEQVLLNLVSNAVSALDSPDGMVKIRIGTTHLDRVDSQQFHGRRREGGKFAFVEVADNGRGIEEEQLEHIFEPFHTEGKQGRGLGLALVYGNVVRHNGLIECSSKRGEGTVMRVLLPSVLPDSSDLESLETPDISRTYRGGHAVVIDDESKVLVALERMLVSNGWTCDTYEKPLEALAYLNRNALETDCVVIDVRMPEMDGRNVVEVLLERHPQLPVIVVSGYSKFNLREFRRFPNVVNTVEKPFSMESILGSLEQTVKTR